MKYSIIFALAIVLSSCGKGHSSYDEDRYITDEHGRKYYITIIGGCEFLKSRSGHDFTKLDCDCVVKVN